ncbi:hypothetical protein GQ457_12G015710 [Hibiscus cannabinus]
MPRKPKGSSAGNRICFGRYALQELEPAWITSRQIEAGRRAMTRNVRRGGKIWVRIFPDKPVTPLASWRLSIGTGTWVSVCPLYSTGTAFTVSERACIQVTVGGLKSLGIGTLDRVPVRRGLYRYSSSVPVQPFVSGKLSSLKTLMGIGTPCTVPVP